MMSSCSPVQPVKTRIIVNEPNNEEAVCSYKKRRSLFSLAALFVEEFCDQINQIEVFVRLQIVMKNEVGGNGGSETVGCKKKALVE